MLKSTGFLFISIFLILFLTNLPALAQSDTLFYEPFNDMSNWTAAGPLGQQNWSVENSNFAGGHSAPEVRFTWEYPFTGNSYLLASPVFTGMAGHNMELRFNYYEDYWSNIVYVGAAITGDGGNSYTSIWELQASGNSGPEQITINFTGIDNMQLALYYTGDANDIDFWYVDDITLMDLDAVPVELSSFSAAELNGDIVLNWTTATETNNKGFEIQKAREESEDRIKETEWEAAGFIEGKGTSTEPAAYTFSDTKVNSGKYLYRLKQVNFDGTFEYSNEIEAEVSSPSEFSLRQNYPNPFNPSTKIGFSIPVDARVKLNIYNVLGQKVKTLIDGDLPSGEKSISFDASSLNSGIYFYQLEASTPDGKKFTSVRKMILTK